MAIQYVGGVADGRAGSVATASQSLSGTLTGGLASSPAEGDLVVIKISAASASGYVPTTLAVSGWTNGTFRSNTGVANYSYQQYSYKFMGSTPDSSITIPSSGNARNAQRWAVHVFRNVSTSNPLDVTTVFASGTASGRPDPGAITPSTAGAWILWMGSAAAATGAAFTAPTDFATNWRGDNTVDTYDCMDGFGYYTGWTANQYDPAAISAGGTTGSTDSWVAETLVLRPGPVYVSGSGSATNTCTVQATSYLRARKISVGDNCAGTTPAANAVSYSRQRISAAGTNCAGSTPTANAYGLAFTQAKSSAAAGTSTVEAHGAKIALAKTSAAGCTSTVAALSQYRQFLARVGDAAGTATAAAVADNVSWAYDEAVYPEAILFVSNLSGVVGSIDESVDTPDGNWLLVA